MKNMGVIDRIVRIIVGIAVLSLMVFVSGNLRFIGLIGVIPLFTGIVGFCPLYTIFGIHTNHRV